MQIVEIIKKRTGLATYSIAKVIKERFNVDISRTQLDNYAQCNSIRLDVLASLRRLGKLSWSELGKIIDKEYLD